jgi:hypothetical protein
MAISALSRITHAKIMCLMNRLEKPPLGECFAVGIQAIALGKAREGGSEMSW